MITDNHHPTLRFLKKLCSSFSLTVWCYGPSLYCPKTTRNVDSSDHSTIFLVASVHLEGARARGSWLRLLMFWMYGFLLCMLDLTCIYSDNVCLRLSCSDILNAVMLVFMHGHSVLFFSYFLASYKISLAALNLWWWNWICSHAPSLFVCDWAFQKSTFQIMTIYLPFWSQFCMWRTPRSSWFS